jgi:hypothetical protein
MSKVLIFIDWFAPGYKAGGPITSNVNIVEHLSDKLDFYVITSSFDYHATTTFNRLAPMWNHELSYLERSVCTILIIIETYSDNVFGFRHC